MIGTDTHEATHTAAAVVRASGQLAGELIWAIEDRHHVAGSLERFLVARGERVAPRLMGETRRGGKSGSNHQQPRRAARPLPG